MTQRGGMCAALAAAGGVFFLSAGAEASPWGRRAGEGFSSLRLSELDAQAPAAPGALGPLSFSRQSADFYGEYGLTPGWTIGGKVIVDRSIYFDGFDRFEDQGLSEAEGFVQHQILATSRSALAARIAVGAPTRRQFAGRPDAVRAGEDLDLRLLYGRQLTHGTIVAFATAETGWRKRFGPGADQWRAETSLGLARGRWLALGAARLTYSFGGAGVGGSDYDLTEIEGALFFRLSRRLSLGAGYLREVASRNVVRGGGGFVSLWARF